MATLTREETLEVLIGIAVVGGAHIGAEGIMGRSRSQTNQCGYTVDPRPDILHQGRMRVL